ncbi:MAG: XdhC family protein [Porticoccaceae bacterium]|nr:XdhC family protein [Porticoccaceae bacterium]
MSNRIERILAQWYSQRDELQWVLATVVATQGSSYRKSGAFMLIDSLGRCHGLVSGGCLEADVVRRARRCWADGNNHLVQYDMREEGDFAAELGIGCGGMVHILLQPVSADNRYLQLDRLRQRLEEGQPCYYRQNLAAGVVPDNHFFDQSQPQAGDEQVVHHIKPAPHIAVFGGGVDARPLVAMAGQLGWRITLVESRVGYGRQAYFPEARQIVRQAPCELVDAPWLQQLDGAVIMHHSLSLDGRALKLLQTSSAGYVGMLGPTHRTEKVLAEVGLSREALSKPLANPVGLALGGELPESIALSIVAEMHAVLEGGSGGSLSDCL